MQLVMRIIDQISAVHEMNYDCKQQQLFNWINEQLILRLHDKTIFPLLSLNFSKWIYRNAR